MNHHLHAAPLVNAWMKRAEKSSASPKALLTSFQQVMGAVWRRALPTLGDVTVSAIAGRAITVAAEKAPLLSAVKPEPTGISVDALHQEAAGLNKEELGNALTFLLTEFLSMLARLTGGILDEELRAALVQDAPARPPASQKREPAIVETPAKKGPQMKITQPCLETGVRNLDAILGGGLPRGAVCLVGGAPGSGKTILAQQIAFHNASPESPAIIFNTLSEPAAKTLSHLNQFAFFDRERFGKCVHLLDLGVALRQEGLAAAAKQIMDQVAKIKPGLVVIDSFKTFFDIAKTPEEFRGFIYEMGVNLMAWECTSLLVGEYSAAVNENNPLISMVDGQIMLSQLQSQGDGQRFIQVRKMRGTGHSTDQHSFSISARGIDVYAPRLTITRKAAQESVERQETGIPGLDELLAGGVTRGSTILVGGAAGTGKTVLLLELIYRGALAGQKGLFFSFEETEERLREAARSLGFDFDAQIAKGMIKIVFIPQPDIRVEKHLLLMQEEIQKNGIARVAIDSLSVFLHKIQDPQLSRERVFQLSTLVQNAQGTGFFSTDVPYGSSQMSYFGVEETVLDGVLRLSSSEEGMERERYIEAYKLRTTAHLMGRHAFVIKSGGVRIFPRHESEPLDTAPPPPMASSGRLSSGVPGLDEKIGGGFLQCSQTILSGSSGSGKTTFAFQFLLEGAKRREKGLFVTLAEGPEQVINDISSIGLPVRDAIKKGFLEILYLSPKEVRAGQFLSILTERVKRMGAQRLVFDSMSGVVAAGLKHVPLGDLLYTFAFRFKTLGVTTMVTVESRSSYSEDPITEMDFSPIADNIILIRYHRNAARVAPALRILKTRGSAHDSGVFLCPVSKGGMSLGPLAMDDAADPARQHRHRAHRLAKR